MNIYAWTLSRNGMIAEQGAGSAHTIVKRLAPYSLPGAMPMAWILAEIENDPDINQQGAYHHDRPRPNEWKLTWTKIA